jgi:hypothetical protein
MPAGRPTKYREEFEPLVYKLALLGATDAEMSDILEISVETFNVWKREKPRFSESLKNGKAIADANVASRLYERAVGYEHPEEKIFQYEGAPLIVPTTKHYPPDTAAATLWLKNRQGDKWRDKTEVDHTGNVTVEIIRLADTPPGE